MNVEKSGRTMAQRGASELQLVNGGGARVLRTGQRRRLGWVPGGYRGVRDTYIGWRGGALACGPSRGAAALVWAGLLELESRSDGRKEKPPTSGPRAAERGEGEGGGGWRTGPGRVSWAGWAEMA